MVFYSTSSFNSTMSCSSIVIQINHSFSKITSSIIQFHSFRTKMDLLTKKVVDFWSTAFVYIKLFYF